MILLAHPKGFEPLASAFGAMCILAIYLILFKCLKPKHREQNGKFTVLSGHNPDGTEGLRELIRHDYGPPRHGSPGNRSMSAAWTCAAAAVKSQEYPLASRGPMSAVNCGSVRF